MPPGYYSAQLEDHLTDRTEDCTDLATMEPASAPDTSAPVPRLHRDERSLQRWLDLSA